MKKIIGVSASIVAASLSFSSLASAKGTKIAIGAVDQAWLDTNQAAQIACTSARKAAQNGAKLIVFTEGFIGGYPYWHYVHPTLDVANMQRYYQQFYEEGSIYVDGSEMKKLRSCARKNHIAMVVPFNEKSQGSHYKDIYNSAAYISTEGRLKHITRKARASHTEKMFWAEPNEPDIRVVKLAGINVAYNSCWQTYVPLIRAIEYAQGAQLLVSGTQDFGPKWDSFISNVANEGNVYLASVSQMYNWKSLETKDAKFAAELKNTLQKLFHILPSKVQTGEGIFVDPHGKILQHSKPYDSTIVYGDVDVGNIVGASVYRDNTNNFKLPIDISYRGRLYVKDGVAVDKVID